MLKRTINIPIYQCRVVIVFDTDINEQIKLLFKKDGVEDDGSMYNALVYRPAGTLKTYYLMYGTSVFTLNIFVHELSHLSGMILKDRGENGIDSEPLAYLAGYLAEEVEKIMLKNNIDFIKPKLKLNGLLQKKTNSN